MPTKTTVVPPIKLFFFVVLNDQLKLEIVLLLHRFLIFLVQNVFNEYFGCKWPSETEEHIVWSI